jgi:hypothetical protein
MIFHKVVVALAFASVSPIATAQMGTPEEQAACRPDVRKFCYKIPRSAGIKAFQNCLVSHQNRLSPKCKSVLTAHKA